MILALAMVFVVSTKDCFCRVGYLGCYDLCVGLIRLVLLQALGSLPGWSFVERETFPCIF